MAKRRLVKAFYMKKEREAEIKSYEEYLERACKHCVAPISDCVYCNDKEYDLVWNSESNSYKWTEIGVKQ